MFRNFTVCVVALAALAAPSARADIFGTYGDTTVVSAGPAAVYQLVSDPNGLDYAGIYDQITGSLDVSQLVDLEASYEMTSGTFGNGAPRFSLIDTTNNANNEAYIYWGAPTSGGSFSDPNAGSTTLSTTTNYADLSSSDVRVYVNGFDGINQPNTGVTWAQFVAEAGNADIGYVSLDLDGGYPATQAMLVSNFTVNGVVVSNETAPTPEPSALVLLLTFMALVGGITFHFKRRSA
jgi:hypothetical protein